MPEQLNPDDILGLSSAEILAQVRYFGRRDRVELTPAERIYFSALQKEQLLRRTAIKAPDQPGPQTTRIDPQAVTICAAVLQGLTTNIKLYDLQTSAQMKAFVDVATEITIKAVATLKVSNPAT